MKPFHFLVVATLLGAAPASQLSARNDHTIRLQEHVLDAATAQRVLTAAASHYGTTYTSLEAEHQSGAVQIYYLGPGSNGHWYEVVREGHPRFRTEDIIIA